MEAISREAGFIKDWPEEDIAKTEQDKTEQSKQLETNIKKFERTGTELPTAICNTVAFPD